MADHHAGGQRVVGLDDPRREGQPSARRLPVARRRDRRRRSGDDRQESRFELGARVMRIATDEQMGRNCRSPRVGQAQNLSRRHGLVGDQFGDAAIEGGLAGSVSSSCSRLT